MRVPFIKFILKAELIAIKEFSLNNEYRRYFDGERKLFKDKFIDTYDIIAFLFISVITLCCYLLFKNITSLLVCIPFFVFHHFNRKMLDKIKESIQNTFNIKLHRKMEIHNDKKT